MLCTTLSDGKQTFERKRTTCSSVAPVGLYCAPVGCGFRVPSSHPSAARHSGGLHAVTAWLPRHEHTTHDLRLRSAAACQHLRRALMGRAAACTASDALTQSARSPVGVLMSVGMSRDAAEAALRQAAGDDGAAAAEHLSPIDHSADSAAHSNAGGSTAIDRTMQHSDGAEQQHLHQFGQDGSEVRTEQHSLVAADEQTWINGNVWVSGSTQLLQADRVSAAVQGLLDAGVPVHMLAAVIAAHPTALVADPDTEWKPRVRRLLFPCLCSEEIQRDLCVQSARREAYG